MLAPMRTLALGLVLITSSARADNSTFRPYIVGSRASGMGGAFTALADDGAGPYYNPGGIAFVHSDSLSLFVSAYGLIRGTFSNALGDGHDFTFSTLDTFPISSSVVFQFGHPDETGEPPPHAIALSAFVPDAIRIDDRDSLGSVDNTFFFTYQTKTVWAGATYARRIGRLGIGGGAYLLIGDSTTSFDLSTSASNPAHLPFGAITARTDESTLGVVGSLGARWDATDHAHLGLSVFTPAFGRGTRRLFARAIEGSDTAGGTQVMVLNANDLHASPTQPLRVQAGGAWTDRCWTFAADLVFLGPRTVDDDRVRAADGLDRRIVRHAVLDASLGAERALGRSFTVRAGVYTDFAASPDPAPTPGSVSVDLPDSQHVDHYGATGSVGYHTAHTATNVGVIVNYGTGHGLSPDNLNFASLVPQPTHQLYLYVMASSSYEF
jgi:long-chain fatty acid transport protein